MCVSRLGAGLLAALLFCLPAAAAEVTLTARDGGLTLQGRLLGYDGEVYRISTVYGELTVDALGVACSGEGCPAAGSHLAEVTFSGAETLGAVLIPALFDAFAASRGLTLRREIAAEEPGAQSLVVAAEGGDFLRIRLRLTTTETGFADLLAGQADVVMAAREVTQAEVQAAREAGLGTLSAPAQSRVVALDALVALVAPDNPLRGTGPELLAAALAGQVTDWGSLGGPEGRPIRLHALDARLGAQQAVEGLLLAPFGLELAAGARRHADPAALADALLRDPEGLAVTFASAIGTARALPLAGNCGILLRPTEAAIRSEDYPLTTPMFLYTPSRRLPALLRDFLSFLGSPAAAQAVRRSGLVDLGPRTVPIEAQGARLADAILAGGGETPLGLLQAMIRTLQGAERLSPTFRFRPGAAGLDGSSRASAQRLAEALEAGVYDDRTLIFVGFSDGEGGALANLRIAAARAETVRNAVRGLAETADFERVTFETAAFGEALPMACDDSDWGRQVNRRVEVWLR